MNMTNTATSNELNHLLRDLQQLLPADRWQGSASALAAFQSDGLTAFAVQPLAIVTPQSADEVVQLVRWCHQRKIPFVARGSGTSLSGGSLPHADGIVIALNRLNHIVRLDLPNRLAVVEPGVINSKLTSAVEHAGLYYAQSQVSCEAVCFAKTAPADLPFFHLLLFVTTQVV